jgi:DNA-binding transcriptional ArsR family regulator
VALAVRFLRGRFRRGRDRRWTLEAVARGLGVSEASVRRGLRAAEEAGLLRVARRSGRKILVADVSIPPGPARSRKQGPRPLVVPVPWSWLRPALRLPASAVRVGMACWLQAGWERSARVEFAPGDWADLGLSRFSAGRGLRSLAGAGLVTRHERPGRPAVVTLRVPRDGAGQGGERGETGPTTDRTGSPPSGPPP